VRRAKGVAQASSRARLGLLAISLRRGSRKFDEVVKMVDEMTDCLKREQESDDGKVKHCQVSMDSSEKQRSSMQQMHEAKEKAISDIEATIEAVKKKIEDINHGIQELDDYVKKATDVRKAENTEFKEIQQENNAALEILRLARNRMAKFYAPEEHVAGPVSLEQGPSNPTRGAPPPPPETFSAYRKKGDANKGVLQMMDTLMSDLDAKNSALAAEEREAQADYEEMMKEAKEKRTTDRKAATEKESVQADAEATLQKVAVEDSDVREELQATTSMLKDLHQECDWLLENHEVRKAARDGEVESLMKTKAILHGADFA
jgi:chromosome segregation ATPase